MSLLQDLTESHSIGLLMLCTWTLQDYNFSVWISLGSSGFGCFWPRFLILGVWLSRLENVRKCYWRIVVLSICCKFLYVPFLLISIMGFKVVIESQRQFKCFWFPISFRMSFLPVLMNLVLTGGLPFWDAFIACRKNYYFLLDSPFYSYMSYLAVKLAF